LTQNGEKLTELTNSEELAYIQSAGSVLMLSDMHKTPDLEIRRAIFEQVCDQESSHISEVLPGVVNTRFNFEIREGNLFAIQPNGVTDWRQMHENGVARARSMAELNNEFKFYEEISKAELSEALAQEQLASYETPVAMITLSLCGDDVASEQALKKLGRDPDQKRAFLRVSWTNGKDSQIYLDSRSVDGMTLADGKQFLKELGAELPEGASSLDVLSTQVLFNGLGESDLSNLADKLVDSYDQKLFEKTGIKHKAGRSESDARDTFEFVLQQNDLLNVHMESLCELAKRNLPLPVMAQYTDNLRYDIMASFKQRLEGNWEERGSLVDSVTNAGGAERASGTVFNGCDTSIGSNTNGNLTQTGMANAQNPENWVWKKGKCQVDECPSRKNNNLVDVGPCDVCKGCQRLFDSKMSLDEINSQYRKSSSAQYGTKQGDLFDAIAADLARFGQEYEQKEINRKKKEKLKKAKEQSHDFPVGA
jgi:hypothetical protein